MDMRMRQQMERAPAKHNVRLSGISIAPGLAMGKAFVYQDALEQDLQAYEIRPNDVDAECERVHQAAEHVLNDLEESAHRVTQQIGPYQAEIFHAHRLMLRELVQSREIRQEIERERINAETAVHRVFQRWASKMHEAESARFIQRAEDVADLGRRLVRALMGISVHPLEAMPEGSVLVAPCLLPSDAVFFASRKTVAIVVESGAPGSHCALLIRQIGIPGVASIPDVTAAIRTGDVVCVDGLRGTVVVEPDEEIRESFESRIEGYRTHWAKAKAHCRESAVTRDGIHVQVMANIATRTDALVAANNGADGVGLYRLEALFMLHKTLPSEQQLLTEISDALAPLQDKPAIVRLLDAGSDKHLPYLKFTAEPSPCLGMRGVRILLAYPELLKVQLRALLRLSQAREIRIMVPMVTVPEDMRAVRQAVESQASELGIAGIPPLVAMIETPAAALCVPEILQFADAISLGTNDLTQYTMAAGRQNPLVHRYFQDDHPAVLRLIRLAATEAGDALVAVCGEFAGRPDAVPVLLEAGVRLLSVAPPLVPMIKEAVRNSSTRFAKE
jgi:phosphotransferase system enzyme I (PtsI)